MNNGKHDLDVYSSIVYVTNYDYRPIIMILDFWKLAFTLKIDFLIESQTIN